MKNYYIILGVAPDATLEQIRVAYRRQAKELHPDYYGQDSEPFRDLQEAYNVLSDPARRRAYDQTKRRQSTEEKGRGSGRTKREPIDSRRAQPEPLIPNQDWPDQSLTDSFQTFSPSFEELFDRLWRNFTSSRPKVERLQPLNVEIPLTAQQARRGGRLRLMIPARQPCPTCQGRGGIGFFPCHTCEGRGVVAGQYPVNLTYPPGINDRHTAQISLEQLGIANFYLRVIFRVT